MKLTTKRVLDHYLGNFCLFFLSFLVRILGSILRRNHDTLPVDSILILKFQGIGSLAIAAPAIHALRLRCQNSKIIFWGTTSTSLFARESDLFDEIIELNDGGPFRAILSVMAGLYRIYQIKIDWMVDLEVYSKLSVLLGTLTLSRNRAGFAIDSVRLRRFNHTHLVFFNRHQYLGKAYDRLLGLINIDGQPPSFSEAKTHFSKQLKKQFPALMPPEKKYIVINPNAGELSLERRWPLEFFEQLIEMLLVQFRNEYNFIIIGSGEYERNHCEGFNKHSLVTNMVDSLSLSETIRYILHADLLISNDSAPLHLGLLSDVPVIGLFGPTFPEVYVDQNRPLTHIHYGEIYCSPCIHYWDTTPCRGENHCMHSITAEQVCLSCVELLSDKGPTDFKIKYGGGLKDADRYYPGLIYAKDDV